MALSLVVHIVSFDFNRGETDVHVANCHMHNN
jgi:hypothetical protein